MKRKRVSAFRFPEFLSVSGIPATEEWEEDYRRSEDRWQNGLVELQEMLARR
jgi:hypothetical protein